MKLFKPLLALYFIALPLFIHAENNVHHNDDPLLKTFITNIKKMPDAGYQKLLSEQSAWKNYIIKNGQWMVSFNEENQLPHFAVGTPVAMNVTADPSKVAHEFLTGQLAEFHIPVNDLVYRNTATNKKYHYVHYKQQYQGLEVLWAKAFIKMTLDNRVMQFSLDVYDDINLNITPGLNVTDAIAMASKDIAGITKISMPVLKVLPVQSIHKNKYHLVYELTVECKNYENVPAAYYTLIDANTGAVLYRQNNINHIFNATVSGTVYPTQPYNPTAVELFRNMKVSSGGTNYYTDTNGYANLLGTLSSSATFYLEGKWAKVQTAGIVPSFTTTLSPGSNNISFDPYANIKEMSAYQSVQEIHGYYKTITTGSSATSVMDFSINTNIDVSGSCNAFYNGDINFFDLGGGCTPSSEVGDVLYHEYGHGINDHLYSFYGGSFGNGALGEGYADTWANGLTEDPVLGLGFFSNDPNGFIRRYDVNIKVYPQDLVGEVHADGEIIAGAWWDLGLNLGNFQSREALFFETFAATLTAPNGSEGQLFTDVLIEAITNDDNDGNLTNGTPNYCAITNAFALHGIVLNASVLGINNTSALLNNGAAAVTLSATVNGLPGGNLNAHYQLNQNMGSWITSPMVNTSGINYETNIPAVLNGNILLYYFDVIDQCGNAVVVLPEKASNTDPNIPYNMMVGFNQFSINDFDNNGGVWTTGIPGDNATNGLWEIAAPEGTFIDPNNPATVVQPDAQVTIGGSMCAVTNHNAGSSPASFDVDGGRTTLISPTFDLSGHTNPALSYYRWYTNNQFTVMIYDYWKVALSNDNGNTWVPVENTQTDDHSWRRNAIRINDYVTPTSQVKIRFIAEDALPGGFVEALIDDVVLWDAVPTAVSENADTFHFNVYPNPASNLINVSWNQKNMSIVNICLTDALGRIVDSHSSGNVNGYHIITSGLSEGIYFLKISNGQNTYTEKVNIIR